MPPPAGCTRLSLRACSQSSHRVPGLAKAVATSRKARNTKQKRAACPASICNTARCRLCRTSLRARQPMSMLFVAPLPRPSRDGQSWLRCASRPRPLVVLAHAWKDFEQALGADSTDPAVSTDPATLMDHSSRTHSWQRTHANTHAPDAEPTTSSTDASPHADSTQEMASFQETTSLSAAAPCFLAAAPMPRAIRLNRRCNANRSATLQS